MFLVIRLRLCFIGKNMTEVICPSQCTMSRYMISECITGDVNLDLLVKVVFLMFFPYKVIIFPSIIGNYLGRRYFETVRVAY